MASTIAAIIIIAVGWVVALVLLPDPPMWLENIARELAGAKRCESVHGLLELRCQHRAGHGSAFHRNEMWSWR